MVVGAADKNGMIDTSLILSLIDQVNLRSKIFELETRFSGMEYEDDEEEIF
jgi:hypothetical protein